MKKMYCMVLSLAILLIGLSGCSESGENRTLRKISNELNIEISNAAIVADEDTHSGFHGDGVSLVSIQFSDDSFENAVKNADEWHAFPPDETVQTLLYGYEFDNGKYGPFLTNEDGSALLPEITNGYYWLIDRQAEDEKAVGADIIHRNSFNFTVAVYDSDSEILYYCKMDT